MQAENLVVFVFIRKREGAMKGKAKERKLKETKNETLTVTLAQLRGRVAYVEGRKEGGPASRPAVPAIVLWTYYSSWLVVFQ